MTELCIIPIETWRSGCNSPKQCQLLDMRQIQRNAQDPLATIEPWFFKLVPKTPLWIAKCSDYKVGATVLLFQTFIAYKTSGK